jgi:hypothetical protein
MWSSIRTVPIMRTFVAERTAFLNLLSLVRFQPGAPPLMLHGALSRWDVREQVFRIGKAADILPTSAIRRSARARRAEHG